ncbi:MAG: 5-formyltetrahydrofolate cyclo-ligase [Ilumatobacter coccineus]|uniref:5-formyltetrahydrofolate cyclo-ligase n=1 Tax=Ilumatobacter coccineus TaxID=467094 RepID=A0A2G6KGD1_9ACTN|nr:MAG: 5-formyltetrahydrofolate cyclo-ligase [Ilumatobacter coccineus]
MDKNELRASLRAMRRGLTDRPARSEMIWDQIEADPAVVDAAVIMVFDSIPGEPETAPFIARRRAAGQTVVIPEDDPPPDPRQVDVVIVPGVGFTPDGDRLGQGGGWYDRFLAQLRPGTPTIGVCFAEQLQTTLPTEPHDVRVDRVVTDVVPHGEGIDQISG